MDLTSLPRTFGKSYDIAPDSGSPESGGRTLSETPRATVIEAVHIATRQRVAVKFIPCSDPTAAQAVAHALAPWAGVRHPNVVPVVEIGTAGGLAFVAMELLAGGTLAERLRSGALTLPVTADIALDCLKGLAAARRKGLRAELTLESVLLAEAGQAKLAGLTRAEGSPSDQELADLRAVGRLIVALLAGHAAAAEPGQLSDNLVRVPAPLRNLLGDLLMPAGGARPSSEDLAAALRPHASRAAALVDAPAPVDVPLPAAEPLPSTPLFVGGGGAAHTVTAVLRMRTGGAGSAIDPRDQPAGLARLAVPALIALVTFLSVMGVMLGMTGRLDFLRDAPRVLTQAREVESTRASIAFKTDQECFGQIEYWQATSTQTKLRTKKLPIMLREFRASLPYLKPDTTYNFVFVMSRGIADDARRFDSEVFDFTTRPEIQIFNIHVDEYATKAVVTWETNLRTDTTIKYGRTDQYDDLRTNPEQKSETIHSITIEGLNPDSTYHYQILASDPRGRGQPKPSEDLQFRTSKEDSPGDAEGKENPGLVNLTKSYVDKLTRMTPDEREKLKTSIEKFTDPRTVTAEDKELLASSRTNPGKDDDFHNRLQLAHAWYNSLVTTGRSLGDPDKVCRVLRTLFYTNRVQASQRLDAVLIRLHQFEADNRGLQDLEHVVESGDLENKSGAAAVAPVRDDDELLQTR